MKRKQESYGIVPIIKSSNHIQFGQNNKTIIMVMGWMCSISMWSDTFIEKLVDNDFSVIIFNNPGMSSAPNLQDYSFEKISRIIDSFQIKNPILLGWSMGAMIAFYYSLTRHVENCISICGGNVDIGNNVINPTNMSQVTQNFFNKGKEPGCFKSLLYKNVVNQIIPFSEIGKSQGSAMYDYTNNVNKLFQNKINTRLLFITADNDLMVPPQKNIEYLDKNYPKDLLQLYQFKNEGHGVLYTQETKIVNLIKKIMT